MPIKIAIFILFNIHSMHIDLSHINGHDNDIIPYGMDVEHIVVANNIMEYYKNLSLENIEGEIWKDVEDYEGIYQVSNLARIKSMPRIIFRNRLKKDIPYNLPCKIMKQAKGKRGYLVLALWKENVTKRATAHRIVAKAFIPNPENKPFINHIDLNKINNVPINLEWCTAKENMHHAHKNGVMCYGNNKGKFGNESPLSKKVGQHDLQGNLINIWESTMDAQRKGTGFMQGSVWKCCSGGKPQYKGFKWQYI